MGGPSSSFFHLDTLKVFCVAVSGECCPSWEQLHVNTTSKINKLQCGAIGCVDIATRKKSHLTGVQRKRRAVSILLRISEGRASTRERRSDGALITRAAAREEKSASPVTRLVISCLARFTRRPKKKERLFLVYT